MLHKEDSADTVNIKNLFLTSLIAATSNSGALAGTTYDLTFFPLDTLKTRLQSQHGFIKSGGYKGLYQGLGPVMIGSAPSAAIFFVTYDGIKEIFQPRIPQQYHSFIHMTAAVTADMVSCLIQVPVEVMKQRKQAFIRDEQRLQLRTLYRGYESTVIRNLPFALMQMPLWEYFKHCWKRHAERDCTPMESAICGSISVAITTALTTPLDVAKTRIMLSNINEIKDIKISIILKDVYRKNGIKGLFTGFFPRMTCFTLGGFIFFAIYEKVREICISILPP